MTQLVIAPKLKDMPQGALGSRHGAHISRHEPEEELFDAPVAAKEKKKQGETLEKVVGRIPTLYIIIFFTVFTGCAVLIRKHDLRARRNRQYSVSSNSKRRRCSSRRRIGSVRSPGANLEW
jgi:hypothetical protein